MRTAVLVAAILAVGVGCDATGIQFTFGLTGQAIENQADLGRALPEAASITYRRVATVSIISAIDAVVTFVEGENLIGDSGEVDHIRRLDDVPGSGGTFPFIESELRTTTSAEAWARIRVDFYNSGTYTGPGTGTRFTFTNLSAHFYDIDNAQSVEVIGATTYTLADNTHLTTSSAGTGAIKFTAPNSETTESAGTSYTVGRVTATYASTSSIEYRLFVPPNSEAAFDVDISSGLSWVDDSGTRRQDVFALTQLLPSAHTVTGLQNCPISMPAPVGTNFNGAISFASTSGTVPTGLNFSTTTGAFSGTPTANSSATVGITATGSVAGSATNSVTFAITNSAMTLAPVTLSVTGTTGASIGATTVLIPTNPCATVTYAVTQGTLPPGLSLDTPTGVITGTPTDSSSAIITITATDTVDNTRTATTTVTFAIVEPSQPVSPPPAVADPIAQPVPPTTPTTSTTAVPQPTTPPTPVLTTDGVLPELSSAETLVTENGILITVGLSVQNDAELEVSNQDFELRMRGACTTDCTITEIANGRETIHLDRNGATRFSGFGFLPGSLVHVWIFSEPRHLGALIVAPDGTYDGSFSLADVKVGGYTLPANGFSSDNKNRSVNLGIVVVDNSALTPGPSSLPAAGSNVSTALLALALLRWAH